MNEFIRLQVADIGNLEPFELVHTIGDAHIYLNHLEQIQEQLSRKPRKLPKMLIKHHDNIEDYRYEDFRLIDYDPHPSIKGKVAV